MKAIVYDEYGPPDLLELVEIDKPAVGDGEVLVRVRAASANSLDWHCMRGEPYLMRLQIGLRRPKVNGLGADLAGEVAEVGENVTRFRPGDEVFGEIDGGGWGSFADYVCVTEDWLELKPANLTFEQAAAVPVAGLTALQGLRDHGRVQPGQKVLILGASGGVGTFAVQIAKSFGADLTGVCSTRNVEMVRSIGADRVIDYSREDFIRGGPRYDLIFQLAGTHSASDCRRALTPKGTLVLSSGSGPRMSFSRCSGQAGDLSGLAQRLRSARPAGGRPERDRKGGSGVGAPGGVDRQGTGGVSGAQPVAHVVAGEVKWRVGAAKELGPLAFGQQWAVGNADGREVEQRSQVEGQAGASGVVAAGRVDQQNLGPKGQVPDRRLQQRTFSQGEQPCPVGGARRPGRCRGSNARVRGDSSCARPA